MLRVCDGVGGSTNRDMDYRLERTLGICWEKQNERAAVNADRSRYRKTETSSYLSTALGCDVKIQMAHALPPYLLCV